MHMAVVLNDSSTPLHLHLASISAKPQVYRPSFRVAAGNATLLLPVRFAAAYL